MRSRGLESGILENLHDSPAQSVDVMLPAVLNDFRGVINSLTFTRSTYLKTCVRQGSLGGPRKNRGSEKAVLSGVPSVSLSQRCSLKGQNAVECHFCFSVVPCLLLGLLS